MATDYAFEAQSKMEVYGAKYLCKRGDVEVEVEIKRLTRRVINKFFSPGSRDKFKKLVV